MADSITQELSFEGPIHELQRKIEELESFADSTEIDLSGQIDQLRTRCRELQREVVDRLTPWERISLARHPQRPVFSDYLANTFEDALELHGDQAAGDDHAMFTGLVKFRGQSVMLMGHRKGKNTKERIACNFGSAHPEGYRKALLKMRLAEKFKIPVVCLIDTPGAYPGVEAEERGQAQAIARNILEMSRLKTQVVCIVIGEGGSGGALGIGVGDKVLMLENAYYSVISPEGCSSILWKSADHAQKAAAILKLTAKDLIGFKIVDGMIKEPLGGGHQSIPETCRLVGDAIADALEELSGLSMADLLQRRYEKVRRIGVYLDGPHLMFAGERREMPEPKADDEPAEAESA